MAGGHFWGACMAGVGGVCGQGGMHGQGVCGPGGVHACIPCTPPKDMAGQCPGSMHPTGMYSCFPSIFSKTPVGSPYLPGYDGGYLFPSLMKPLLICQIEIFKKFSHPYQEGRLFEPSILGV